MNIFKHTLENTENEEEEKFQEFFMDFYPSLLSFATHYVVEKEVAEDIVQDVFVRLWEGRRSLAGIDDLSAYTYQTVRFRCFNYLRNEKIKSKAIQTFTVELVDSDIEAYVEEETFRLLMKAVEELPPACRTIFSLTLEGYKAKSIAEQLRITVETVKKQKQIARKILKTKLKVPFVLFLL